MQQVGAVLRAIWSAITGLGRVVGAVGLLCWVGAWFTGWEELAIIAAICLVALAIAVLFTLGKSDFEIDLELQPQRVVVGERAGGEMLVRNVGGRRSLPVRVELTIGKGAASFRVPSLADGAEHDELFSVPTSRRAIIPVGPASTVRGDPVGLLRREHEWTTSTDLYVHPRISSLERLGSGFLRDLEGQTTQDLSPSDVAFHTLREYVPGDDRRHVHWKTTARIGKLMVRQFVDTRRSFLSIIISTDPADYADPDEFELAISMASSIGVKALRDDQTVTVIAGNRTVPSPRPVSLLDSMSGIELTDRHGSLIEGVGVANRVSADASIVALAVGSTSTVPDVRAAAARLKADARVLVFRADPDGISSFRTIGETSIINAPTLDEYSRLLFQVSQT
jgi:uncharacterized protein (DUF58 family)